MRRKPAHPDLWFERPPLPPEELRAKADAKRAAANAYTAARRARLIASGLCIRCSRKLPEGHHKQQCMGCAPFSRSRPRGGKYSY